MKNYMSPKSVTKVSGKMGDEVNHSSLFYMHIMNQVYENPKESIQIICNSIKFSTSIE